MNRFDRHPDDPARRADETPLAIDPAPGSLGAVASDVQARWNRIQSRFVDSPREALEEADGMIADAMERLNRLIGEDRSRLRSGWSEDSRSSTEDLRLVMQSYRRLFDRLTEMSEALRDGR